MTKPKKQAYSGRGGERENAGRPSEWINKQTTAVRVPTVHLEAIKNYAHNLDTGSVLNTVQNQTDLSEQLSEIVENWQIKTNGKEKSPRWENVSKLLQELQNILTK